MRVTFQKDGTRVLSLSTNHEGSPDRSALAKSLEACHENAIKGWPWPSSAGIEGVNGGAGYMIILSSMVWRTFMHNHLAGTIAIDFLTVPTVTARPQSYLRFCVIDCAVSEFFLRMFDKVVIIFERRSIAI